MPQSIQHPPREGTSPISSVTDVHSECLHTSSDGELTLSPGNPSNGWQLYSLESFPHFFELQPIFLKLHPWIWFLPLTTQNTGLLLWDKKNVQDGLSTFLEIVISLSYPHSLSSFISGINSTSPPPFPMVNDFADTSPC